MTKRALAVGVWLVLLGAGCAVETTPPADVGPGTDVGSMDGSTPDRDSGPGRDGGGGTTCVSDGDCSDDTFCNGAETCEPARPDADDRGCVVPGDSPCALGQTCDEVADQCRSECALEPDADGDGANAMACGGLDCDDSDPNRVPGGVEICDAADHDEDCDPTTFGFRDADMDGEPSAACCNDDGGGMLVCGSDCDDTRPGVNPTAPEVCNGRDDDCDTATDEGVLQQWHFDGDGDSFGDPTGLTMEACTRPMDYADLATDCDDTRGEVHPGAPEMCDLIPDGGMALDENCDGSVNEGCMCTGTESRPCALMGICASGTESCLSGTWSACSIAPSAEDCNGLDDDCDGTVDDGVRVTCYVDSDNDGYGASGTSPTDQCPVASRPTVGGCPVNFTNRAPVAPNDDCNDSDSSTNPAAPEICDTRDNDCDGSIDDGVAPICYVDGDTDSYTTLGASGMPLCPVSGRPPEFGGCPAGFTARSGGGMATADCDDSAVFTHPGAIEACDGIDNDCSGVIDDGMRVTCWGDGDDDGYAPSGATSMTYCPVASRPGVGGCPSNYTNRNPTGSGNVDCDDGNRDLHPGAIELCDGIDNDCNGLDDVTRVTCYVDSDNDTYAPMGGSTTLVCPDPTRPTFGYCPSRETSRMPGVGATDCDDADPLIYPGAMERCSLPAVDDNCNGTADEPYFLCYADGDGDTYGSGAVINACMLGGPGYGGCAGGQSSRAGDCDETRNSVYPGAPELCNGRDDDCNGREDRSNTITYYRDSDGDNYGAGAAITMSVTCGSSPPSGYVSNSTDCCDSDSRAHPGVTTYYTTARTGCGGYDYNCVGGETQFFTTTGTCSSACGSSLCSTTAGWVGSTPACGVSASWMNCMYDITGCAACGGGACCYAHTPTSRTQSCR